MTQAASVHGTLEARARDRLAPEFELGTVLSADESRVRFIARARRGAQLDLDLTVIARDALGVGSDEHLARTLDLWASLRHPNVVPIVSFGVADELRWVATPAAPERALAQRLAAGRVPTKSGALQVLDDLCAGLQAAHEIGLIHGHIGLQEIQLLPDGHAVLGEFGLAAFDGPSERDEPSVDDDLVASARALGELLARCREPHRRNGVGPDGLEALATLLARVGSGSRWAERPATPRELAHQARAAVRAAEIGGTSTQPQPLLMVGPASGRPMLTMRLALIGSLLATATAGVWFVDSGAEASELLQPLASTGALAPPASSRAVNTRSIDPPRPPVQDVPDLAASAPETPVDRTPSRPARRDPVRTAPRPTTPAATPAATPLAAPVVPAAPLITPVLEPQVGHLAISSRPWGSVLIDGIRIGDTPLRQVALDAGPRRVRIERPGYAPFDTTITIRSAEVVRLIDVLLVRSP